MYGFDHMLNQHLIMLFGFVMKRMVTVVVFISQGQRLGHCAKNASFIIIRAFVAVVPSTLNFIQPHHLRLVNVERP